MNQSDAQQQLIALVRKEIEDNDKGQFWVTDKVAFNMREMIKQFRKNYWGIYDTPIDPVTKEEKLWIPLTRLLCDAVRKGANVGPKDVRFRGKRAGQTGVTQLVRGFIREWMHTIYLNFALDQLVTVLTIDGIRVWKTYWNGKKLVRNDVDVLNCYIDPTSDSIQQAYRFTERALLSKNDVKSMSGWLNTSEFKVTEDIQREEGNAAVKKGPLGDVYESWGKYPNKLVKAAMGQKHRNSDESEIDAQIVISGLNTGHVVFHYASENTAKDKDGNIIKPYEEAWYMKIPGCWFGLSVAWTVMGLQEWINMVINLRIKKNTAAQLGLLKIKKGSGVTQQMLTQLVARGVIELNDPETDLAQLKIDESGQSSYEDEKTAKQWAQEVTSIFDINLGDLPASTSATGAAIQSQQSNSAMTLVVEGIEHFVQRWIDRHVLPHVPEMIKKKGYVTLFRDFDDIKRLRERVVSNMAMEALDKIKAAGQFPTEEAIFNELQRAQRQLEEQGDLFVEVLDEIIASALDTEVFMTNAEIDVGVTVRNLLELRNGLPPEAFAEMTSEALDLLGLQVPSSLKNPQATQQPQDPNAAPGTIPAADPALVTSANTLSSEQR